MEGHQRLHQKGTTWTDKNKLKLQGPLGQDEEKVRRFDGIYCRLKDMYIISPSISRGLRFLTSRNAVIVLPSAHG